MSDPDETGESHELEQIAEKVAQGRDNISVPAELLAEPLPPPAQKSLPQRLREMTVGERIKLALKGPKEVRGLLLRDSNRVVRKFVLKNPGISDTEIIALAKNRTADQELLRAIAANRDWTRNYQVKLGLVGNPKTPLQVALRHLSSLMERDLRALAKSKNVPSAISSQARRMLFERQSVRG